MKKLFGGINLTWKKLIIFSIAAGVYTALMAILPITKDTSFRDIAVYFEWWILFGIIIICNSKSPIDSALKCFVFFLISQPLIYLIQVPFSSMGFEIFIYYRYWFMWTLACLPMGFIGYYIKKKNVVSMIILLPMLLLLTYMGIGYFKDMINDFPHHLLSFMACFLILITVVLNIFDKTKLKIITLLIVVLCTIGYAILNGEILNNKYEIYKTIDNYGIDFVGEIKLDSFKGTAEGDVEVVNSSDDIHSIKIIGRKNAKYEFTLTDDSNKEYNFEYYFDKAKNTVVIKRQNKS